MSQENANVIDFYKQLSLLVDSNLPLPEAITQLGLNFRRGDFKAALLSIGEETGHGRTLSETMKEHSRYFTPLQIQMVETGEKNGNLSEVLAEIANMANINMQLLQMIREIAIYPAITILLAAGVLSFLLVAIIPQFKTIFEEMLGGAPLPWLTQTVIDASDFFATNQTFIFTLFGLMAISLLWLFTETSSSTALFNNIVRRLPLSGQIFTYLTLAKTCSFLSTLLEQKTPMPDALNMVADLIEDGTTRKSLRNVAKSSADGLPLDESLEREGHIFDMIRLTMKHAQEDKLSEELTNLAAVYRQKAASSIKKAEIFWEVALIMGLSILIGGIVISVFMPLITIVRRLGGN